MENALLYPIVRDALLTELAREKIRLIPAVVQVRHVHLSRKDAEKLLGTDDGHLPALDSQESDQAGSRLSVMLLGPRGVLTGVRVRRQLCERTRVELSISDCLRLGIKPTLRLPGNITETPGLRLSGPAGSIDLGCGALVAERHLHMPVQTAAVYALSDGDRICVRREGIRPTCYENVIVRIDRQARLELHLDTDEGNAAAIRCGDLLEIIREVPKL